MVGDGSGMWDGVGLYSIRNVNTCDVWGGGLSGVPTLSG